MDIKPERLLAGQQVAAKILMEMLGKIAGKGREKLEPEIDTDDSVPAYLPDGTRVGKVKRSKVAKSARVVDQVAFFEWVRKHRPDAIEEEVVVARVSNEFTTHCLKRLKDTGVPVLSGGEVVPGIELVEGSASYTVEPYDDATEHVLEYVKERGVAALAIESGDPA